MTSCAGDDDAALVREWATVVRAVDAVQHSLAARLESVGVSLPYLMVLSLLLDAEDQRLPMSRIARDLAMTSGGFTKLADRMARDGLIDRRGSAGDRRVVFAALTDPGRELAERSVAVYRGFLRDEVLQRLSREELTAAAAIADRLVSITREISTEAEAEASPFELVEHTPHDPERRARA